MIQSCILQDSLSICVLQFFCLPLFALPAIHSGAIAASLATMGFFDSWGNDGASVVSRKSHRSHKSSSSHKHKRDKSQSRSHSRERRHKRHSSSGLAGLLGEDSNYSKHNASRGSFFNLGNSSTRSFFSMGGKPPFSHHFTRLCEPESQEAIAIPEMEGTVK